MQPAARLAPQAWMREEATVTVMRALNADGATTRFVGGAVRDALLGRRVADVDLATDLVPAAVMQRLDAVGVTTVPTGIRHGTVTAVAPGRHFEITTLRVDVETDGRHARVAFGTDWVEDARRRDFTMNALYLDADGTLYDPTGGRPDLEQGRVRFVGAAAQRIAEDYLRVLRFFRFQAHFGRTPPDPEALAACRDAAPELARLSAERIRAELLKLLAAPDPTPTVRLMLELGCLAPVLPEARSPARLAGMVRAEATLGLDADPIRRLAALLEGADAAVVAARLRLSNREAGRLAGLLAAEPPPTAGMAPAAARAAIYRGGSTRFLDRLVLAAAASDAPQSFAPLLALARDFAPPKLPLAGRHLMALGVEKGPRLGELLRAAEAHWIAGDFTADRKQLLAWVKQTLSSSA